ncbi:hypothetical protein ASPACDRAFT_62192 [Aspergillus aculeatus ATCC 16872]|uniref:Uncharacterized protein n=1 Tax=Aspergillus aculeatus (strain ATCC 16872 / CBS 172.66 / WB 5094) TaxID=690307 RepID=A0A1L9WP53_ASPA1|nr:uncharacterized protein ASPACDRAFT_62192 [Aspergillus aculeatus ATCC 16872]OJJ97927.1 hypothetical protein ASPACDRAFT_62192 [Aspergillus aculeatus ATCC 16872]
MFSSIPSSSISSSSSTPSTSSAGATMLNKEMACYFRWRPFLDAWPSKIIIRLIVRPRKTTALHSEDGWARARTELHLRMRLLRDRYPYPRARRFGGVIFWEDQMRFYRELLELDYYPPQPGGQVHGQVHGQVDADADADADTRGLEMADCGEGLGPPTPEAVRMVEGWLWTLEDNDPQGGVWGLLIDRVDV